MVDDASQVSRRAVFDRSCICRTSRSVLQTSPANGEASPRKNSEKPTKCESSPPKTSSRNSNSGGTTKREVGQSSVVSHPLSDCEVSCDRTSRGASLHS